MATNLSFGEYITNQYGLLRQILSYLKPCDLASARLVCQDWSRVVDTLIDKNPIMVIREMDKNTVPYFTNRKPILPAFVLHHPPAHSLEDAPLIQCWRCGLPFILGLCPCTVIGPDTVYISVSTNGCESHERCDHDASSPFYRFCQSFMGLAVPASDQIKVSVFYAELKDPIFKQPITEETVNRCFGGLEPIKCVLVLNVSGGGTTTKWIKNLLTEVVYRQGMTFVIGGGEVGGVDCKKKSHAGKQSWTRCDLVLITLRGDNVIAHGDILDAWSEPEMKTFMKKLKTRVGPLPEGATRMAFLAQCVDRMEDELESIECKAFREAFPSLPLLGMQVYGEYGVRSTTRGLGIVGTEKSIKRRRMNISFLHSRTSSFVVLTFKKV